MISTSANSASGWTAISGPETGPPRQTGRWLSHGDWPTSCHNSRTVLLVGRFKMTPSAPSSLCWISSTTERAKFGSSRFSEASRKCPSSESIVEFRD